MAVVLKINPGFDASYPWREVGAGAAASGGPVTSPLEYYLAPADKGGEPPGRWAGRGLAVLGLAGGQVIDREVFEPLFGQHTDPRDPSGVTRLGRAPQRFAAEDDIYRELLAAEPHASEARKAELRSLARAQTRHAVPFWDVTVSVSKSITLFYGGLLARAEHARQARDLAGADGWERDAARVWEAIMEGNAAALTYLQDEAGITRTGYHRGTGAETMAELGKWEHARDWVIGSFRQHTSRTGDPQLHVHNLVLAKVLTERDGRWRKLDSKALYRFQGASAAIAAAVTESALTREFGVAWVPRRDGHGREIAGISQELMDAFSSRRQTITERARQIADQRQAEHGRPPDARQMHLMLRDIALRTRPPKHNEALDLRASLRDWEETARARDLGDLAAIPDAVTEAAGQACQDAPDVEYAEQAEHGGPEHPLPGAVLRVAHDMAEQFARQHGRAPERAQLWSMERFAGFVTLRGTDITPVDPVQLLAAWERQEQRDADAQAELRRDVARAEARAGSERVAERVQERAREQERLRVRAYARPAQLRTLAADEARQLMAEAVWTVQNKMATWTKADLIRHLGEALPAHTHANRATLETLADRAIGGGGGEAVALLFAPEWPRVPECLRRSDGESVFRPHGAERYSSQAQLTLEEQLLAQAQTPGAPRLAPDLAARLLGADRARLEAALRPEAQVTTAAQMSERTGSGLRVDQAAAAYFVATSPRRTEVMIGPPGTGKTRTAVELARMWTAVGAGPAIALTTSSNARNVIRDEAARHGVALQAFNTAEWLGHSERARESRHPVPLAPGTLISVDEASMMPLADLAAIQRRATRHGAKVVITGDPMQLQAVESGGGMTLFARRLGYVQLSEAGRFADAWEAEASLRLREGDVTALAEYREHGRLHAGHAENILEDAARAYLHDRLNGQDTLLMAGTDGMAAELARRVRGDLIAWGLVSHGPTTDLRDGAVASAGDWIMARRNVNSVDAGEPGRGLSNRDTLQITSISAGVAGVDVEVRRLVGRDRGTGGERWSAPFLLSREYLREEGQLAYAVNFHAAEGRTVDSGVSVFTGEEDRQAVNVALTRGRNRNEAWVITGWRVADPAPGPRRADELARYDRLAAERAGLSDVSQRAVPELAVAEEVLGTCLVRDGQQLSATDTREAAWSDADRLDLLGVQWQHVIREAQQRRYEAALRGALSSERASEVLADSAATWLWRSLREAEAAGLDGHEVLRRAVTSGQLGDAESVAKVIDWRIRQQITGMPAVAARPWLDQTPKTGDPDLDRYARELAEAMDERQRRLGEHAAENQPAWTQALGPVPEHPLDRADWEHRAGQVAAYREMWGWTHPYEPVSPRPGRHSPEAQAAWQAAAEALGWQPGSLREHSDGQLWAWRSAFGREMVWAPPYKGDDLAVVRAEIRRTEIEADRARRHAQAAANPDTRERLADRAAVLGQWQQMTRDLAERLAEAQAGYDAWEQATGPTRSRAVAADAELRRRYPDRSIEPLRAETPSPEPQPAVGEPPPKPVPNQPQKQNAEPGPAGWPDLGTHAERIDKVAAQLCEISDRLDEAAMRKAAEAQERAAEITSLQMELDDPDAAPVAAWKTELQARQREAVRHEPMPRVPRAEAVAAEAQAGNFGREAAD
jgi:DNA transposition AAA+ family ATPase